MKIINQDKLKKLEEMNADERFEAFANHMVGIKENKELKEAGVGLQMCPGI